MGKKSGARNGKIEILRFLFCLAVLFFHGNKYLVGEDPLPKNLLDLEFIFFRTGSIGVEFFFLVSGYLLAASVFKTREALKETAEATLSRNTLSFMKKKYLSIIPQHLTAYVIVFAAYVFARDFGTREAIDKLFNSIPNILLIQMSGVSFTNPNHIEWYLSCMFIAMAIIYPLCYKFYYTFTRCVAPVFSLLMIGYLIANTNYVSGVSVWMDFAYKGYLRALAEIALGTTAFEIVRSLKEKDFSPAKRAAFTAVETICFIGMFFYCITTVPSRYESYALIVIFVMVVLAFSELSYGSRIFNNKLCYFLGKMSLPIYLVQLAPIYAVPVMFPEMSPMRQVAVASVASVALAFVVMAGGSLISSAFKKAGIK